MEINSFCDKDFKVMVVKMLTELGGRMGEHSEDINKEMENIGKYRIEVIEQRIQ